MKTFKRFLKEEPEILYESSTKFSTHMETVIGECFDAAWVQKNSTKKAAIEILKKKQKTTEFKTVKKHWKSANATEAAEKLLAFGNKVKKAVKSEGKYKIQAKGQMTDDWMTWADKKGTDTSKTDVIIGGLYCSVKNAGGAQLMSGKKGESKATVEAAAQAVKGFDDEIKENLTGLLNNLQEHTTDGYYASMDLLKRFKASNPGKDAKMYDWAKRTVDNWDKVNIPYEKLKKALPNYIKTFPIKKSKLSKAVLDNPKNLVKIAKIVHPEVRTSLNNFIKKNQNKRFVVLDIPLLLENKINRKEDILIFVYAKKKEINKRLKQRYKNNLKIVKKFKKFQLPIELKKKKSDFIVKNNFRNNKVKKNVKKILEKIILNA